MARRRGTTSVAVGYDGRHYLPELADALAEGLAACGLSVSAVARGPRPMLNYACHALQIGTGMTVTGSHNPPEYNGFKLSLLDDPFFGDDIRDLCRVAAVAGYENGQAGIKAVPMTIRTGYCRTLAAAVR